MLNKLIANTSLFDARAGDDQWDADDGVVVPGGLAAQVVVHEHFAVIGHKDEIAVLKPAGLLQSLEGAADLLVDVDKVGEVELAVVAPVWDPVSSSHPRDQ